MASRRSSRLASKALANAAAVPTPASAVAAIAQAPAIRAPRKRKSETLDADADTDTDAKSDTSRAKPIRAKPNSGTKRTVRPAPAPTVPAVASALAPPVGIHFNSYNKETFLQDAIKHLIAVDARLKPLIEKHHCEMFSPEGLATTRDPWESLVSSIISQQVSGAAARSIRQRFIALFDDASIAGANNSEDSTTVSFPTPAQVLTKDIETLRTAGLSQRKAEYVLGLSSKFESGELSREFLLSAPYDELVARLTAVRGLGLWSVEMFAVFTLKQPDVCSLGDLGVQRGIAAFMGRDVAKLKTSGKGKWKYMNEADMREISERFRPYRSLFMWYIWRVENMDIEALESAMPKTTAVKAEVKKPKPSADSKSRAGMRSKVDTKSKAKATPRTSAKERTRRKQERE